MGQTVVATQATRLLDWYDRHARVLPWRTPPQAHGTSAAPDPYRVWLSEIMLQQTTVATVRGYFETFTRRWPTVEALAASPVDAVLGAWAGLGYYARARNLHACAKAVVERHGGRFPETAEALAELPGIGAYTSAAIAAIAFGESVAVVDGNVERVVTRLFAIDASLPAARPEIRRRTAAMTPARRPGDFAQAMMDLGATICTPKRPACVLCPLSEGCEARRAGTMERYPVKLSKKAKPARRGAGFVAVRRQDRAVWLRRRAETGMLGGMAEPPTTGWSAKGDGIVDASGAPFAADWRAAGSVVHVFTHFTLTLDVFTAELEREPDAEGWWSSPNLLPGEALPTLMTKAIAVALASATGEIPSPVARKVGRPRKPG